jgi:hypothetical protein
MRKESLFAFLKEQRCASVVEANTHGVALACASSRHGVIAHQSGIAGPLEK